MPHPQGEQESLDLAGGGGDPKVGGRPISARTRCNGPVMISESGGRRARAGHPPPGNRRNFVRKQPEIQVETFAFDADDEFSPMVDSLGDDDDVQFAAWAATAKGDTPEDELLVDDDHLSSLLAGGNGVSSLSKDDDIGFGEEEQEGDDVRAFDDDDDEGEEDDEDEDEDEDDRDDILDELDMDGADDDDDVSVRTRRVSSRKASSTLDLSLSGIDLDADDEVTDDEEILDTLVDDSVSDIFDIDSVLPEKLRSQTNTVPPAELEAEEFEDPSEAELQSAAELLTDTGLLGLGARSDIEKDDSLMDSFSDTDEPTPLSTEVTASSKKSRAVTRTETALADEEDDEDDEDDIPLGSELDGEKDASRGLDAYSDVDDEEEAEFTLTSKTEGSFGRVWELNEDNYVTITQPGQTYAYELDEQEANDQEMATLRRGAQGGWGSGLQNDSANKYAPGSREWIARRSYDLISQATPREMKLWTKRHSIPPPAINKLYPDMTKPMGRLGKVTLQQSLPDTKAEIRGVGAHFEALGAQEAEKARQKSGGSKASESPERRQRAVYGTDVMLGSTSGPGRVGGASGNTQAQSALERAVKFPCSFKFKVEGSGDGLIDSLISDVERVLQKTLPRSTFVTEPAGRYIRVVFAVEVEEARHVTDLYDAFRHNPLVKFSYG